jgi:hypothetical protein
MLDFLDLVGLLGMIFLRFGIPIILMAGAAYFLKRMDARWEAEARAAQAVEEAEQPGVAPEAPTRPAQPAPVRQRRAPAPGPLPTFVPPPVDKSVPIQAAIQPGMMMAASQHCWDVKGCSEEAKASCAAPANPGVPCWQARLAADGKIPDECVECDIFQRYPTM